MATILIVDDDTRTAEYIGKHLQNAGHSCQYAVSGRNVLDLARGARPDIIVLDVMLPDVSGFEVCRQIRRDPDLYTTPILMLSAMSGEEEILHGLAQGADDYVPKPFQLTNLVQRIENLLRGSAREMSTDGLTSLFNADGIKRELQRKTSNKESFALTYVEIIHLRRLAYMAGPEARERAIRHLALALERYTKASADFVAGHMGSGHFVCLMPHDAVQAFCDEIRKHWLETRGGLYAAIGMEKAYKEAEAAPTPRRDFPMLDVQICVTLKHARAPITPKEMFEVITKLRAKALETPLGGAYIDRRRTQRP